MMSVGVELAITRPQVGQPRASGAALEKSSKWEIGNFLSTSDTKQYAFLSKVYIPGRTATNQAKDDALLSEYQKNFPSFHQDLYKNPAILETIFENATQDRTKLFFIHAVCDAAHTYTYAPNADPRLQNLANRLIDTQLKLFETNGYIPKSEFLSDRQTFRSLYFQHSQGRYDIAHYGPHFGNVLFRLTPHTGDMCFSPLFINYLNRDLSGIDPKAYRYEDLAKDEHFYTKGSGFKTLTDRDAVAHYRWLTEKAFPKEFIAYLARIGHHPIVKIEYDVQARKTLLEDLSKQYWHLGHGSLSHPSAAVEGTHFQGVSVLTLERKLVSSPKRRPLARPANRSHQDDLFSTHVIKVQALPGPHSPLSPESLIQHNPHQLKLWWGLDPKNASDRSDEEGSWGEWHDGALHEEGYNSSENPSRALWPLASTSSSGYSADSENNAMPLQIPRYKRRPNPSVSRPTHLEDARSQSQGEYRRLLDTSSDGASSGSENSDDGRNHPSFRRDFVKEQLRDLYPGRSHRGDPQYPSRLWAPWHAAVLAPSASRTIKPEQPTKQPPFRYIAPSYVERITYMEPEKIIKPRYYIPVIQKRQKDMAYKIGSFFKKLFFAIRMR